MKKQTSFIKVTQLWGIIFLVVVGVSIITFDCVNSYRDFNSRADNMRDDYIASQKEIIKREVNHVVNMINYKKARSKTSARLMVKAKVYEAHAIARGIYNQNKNTKSNKEIQQMILTSLRSIRYEEGAGYYFINRLDGVKVLFTDKPGFEGSNLLEIRDMRGNYVIKDMIKIAEEAGEGYYQYFWTKPNADGAGFEKISFVKRFEPFDWLIGGGLYIDDIEKQIKENLLLDISQVRFGKEGYIFINRFNGDALVSNGELLGGTKKLWEVFNKNPEKMKDIFKKEYEAALRPQGDYIYYSFIKLTDTSKDSPKASFIYGIPEWQWIVGAGVYLDDVEADITVMHNELNDQIKAKTLYFILLTVLIIFLFLLLFNWLTRKLSKDFNLFAAFFNKAAHSDEEVNKDMVQFVEFDGMAENANKMLQKRINAQQSLVNERERLFITIQSIGDGVIATDISGKVEIMNKVAEQLTGWKIESAKGKQLRDVFTIFNDKTRERVENPVKSILEDGKIVGLGGHTVLISRDGDEYQIADSAAPIRNYEGNIIGVVFVFRDITEEYKVREDLRQSERNLRTIFEAAKNVAFVKTDCNGKNLKIIEFSRGAEEIFGYRSEEIINKPFATLYLKNDVDRFPELLGIMNTNKKSINGEKTLVRKSGERFPALYTIHPVFDNDGEITATIAVFIDITDLKKAEEAIKAGEEKFEAFMDYFPGAAYIKDINLRLVYSNKYMKRQIGLEKWIGKEVYELFPPETAERIIADDKKALKDGKLSVEERIPDKNGVVRDFLTHKFAISLLNGETLLGGVSLDITKAKKAEEDLKNSEKKYRKLIETTSEGFWLIDSEGKTVNVNESLCRMLGYSKDEIIGKTPFDFVNEENGGVFKENFSQLTGSFYRSYEILLKRKDGTNFPALFNATSLIDKNNIFTGSFAFVSDITESKRAEEDLQKMEKLRSIGTLAGGIAHDFNNILTGIYGNISMAKEEIPPSSPGFEFLQEVESSMTRATRLTKQLLTFAKGGTPEKENVSIDELVEEVVRFDLSGSNVKPVFKKEKELWIAEADKSQMQQVFSNLTINADQAMPDGGRLFVTLENANISKSGTVGLQKGKYIRIKIRDEGTGIEQKYLGRIFDPYFSTKQEGSGLGLATVYSIMEKHGGHIGVESEIGRGTVFTIYLPASQVQKPAEIEKPLPDGSMGKVKGRLLVMDDEDTICKLVSKMLANLDLSVETASGGRQAVKMYKQAFDDGAPFDIVIMDITIPGGVGGKEAVKDILKIDPGACVIVSSGYASDPIMANYAEYGFKGIVPKPYTKSKLLAVLDRVLR